MNKKLILTLVGLALAIIVFTAINPFSWNEAGNRTIVTTASGKQFVQYDAGMFYAGFFSKKVEFPNQISVSYKEDKADYDLEDNTIEIGKVSIRFNDATVASVTGIVQYVLPSGEKEMLDVYNTHKTPEALVKRRLAPYTQECLQSSSQLMSSEMHYSGGRAQMVQDYLDQLKNGAFLLKISEANIFDSIEKTNKKVYATIMQIDKNGTPKRKFSSIKEYEITVGDAQVTDVDYEEKVDQMLAKKIDAATKASISKQELMTAQQNQLTAEAKGKANLVTIEYQQKQEQTKQVVAAQTQVELAKQDLERQSVMEKAAFKEASKIKILADANAYEKQRDIQANGALEQKLEALVSINTVWANNFGKYTGNIVPTWMGGGSGGTTNAFQDQMNIMNLKIMKDLNVDLKNK
jgi:hypothetical protein